MAKFMIALFLSLTTGFVSYLTYNGTGQEKVETIATQPSVRSNSYSSHSISSGSGSSYNSSSYGYGK